MITSCSRKIYRVSNGLSTDFIMFNTSNASCCFIELYYCCRNDDVISTELDLPSSMPFYLIPKTTACPEVKNTNTSMEVFEFVIDRKFSDTRKVAFGAHPYVTLSGSAMNSRMGYFLCYYEPRVTRTNMVELKLRVENQEINANFPSNIAVLLLYNGRLLRYGKLSSVWLSISVTANCTSFSTERWVKSLNGVGFYNGSFYPSPVCKELVDLTVWIYREGSLKPEIGGKLNLTLFSKINILIVIKAKQLQKLTSLVQDLKKLKEKLERDRLKVTRRIKFETFSYTSTNDVTMKLKGLKVESKGSPRQLHGIIGINVHGVQDMLNSFSSVHNILFITGRTNGQEIRFTNKATLHYKLTWTSPFYRALSKMKKLNDSPIVIIRSWNIKIPISLASYLLQMSFTVSADIVIKETDTWHRISQKLRKVRANNVKFFFIIEPRAASKLFIAAVKEKVSPKNGKIWISGSMNGVFEYGVASKECYKLRPFSCSEEFQGAWMIKSFQPLSHLGSFIDGNTKNNGFSTLRDEKNHFHTKLLRAMVLDGAAAIANGILKLSKKNVTIKTSDIMSTVKEIIPQKLQNFRFGDTLSKFPTNTSYNCLSGWNGTNCSYPQCANYRCVPKRGKCVGNNLCECYPGFHGRDCSGSCKETCKNGICNEGAFGDGTCSKCNWMYEGTYCKTASVLQALITGSVGSLVLVITVVCYLAKVCRQKQGALQRGELDESHWIIQWTELEDCYKVDLEKTVVQGQLCEKIRHTAYFQAKFRQKNVFVKCFKKRPVKLSLEVRMEIRKVKEVDHVNLEKIQAVCLGPPYVAIITELASMGSLYDTLHVEGVEIPLEIKYALMEDISRGILYLHEKYAMPHGRLKSTNCLLHKGWQLKIADVGLRSLRRNIENESPTEINDNVASNPENAKQDSVREDYYSTYL